MRTTFDVRQLRAISALHARALAFALAASFILGCGVQVYNFGGAGRGSQFHVPASAAMNQSPVVQSWIAYSLAKSTCQLQIGGEVPSENSSFQCELRPREVLVKRWATRNPAAETPAPSSAPSSEPAVESDEYLDLLLQIQEADFLEEYVWFYFRERDWPQPEWLELGAFDAWRADHLTWHRPETRIIGYWIEPST